MTMLLLVALLWRDLAQNNPMINPTSRETSHYTHFQRGNPQDATPSARQGGFVLMGGGGDVDEAFEWMSKRGGNGDFLVLRGSGGDGYQQYLDDLTEANSVETLVLKDAEAARDPFVLERVARADAIFLAGGDQWNYVGKWADSPLLDALNGSILKGVPIGGTSAGLAVLGQHLFTAQNGTVTSEEALPDPYHPNITLSSDFLHAPPLEGLVTDSHFSERDRMGRLVTFMSRLQQDRGLDSLRGVGVDEGTAALVDPEGESRTVGKGEAHWVRATAAPESCQAGQPLTQTALLVTSVGAGETFSLNSWSSPDRPERSMKVQSGKLSYE